MDDLTIEQLQEKLQVLDHKLDLLLKKGSNDEKLVTKRKEILRLYFSKIDSRYKNFKPVIY